MSPMGSPTVSTEHCSFLPPFEVPDLKKKKKKIDIENSKNDIVLNSINILFSKQSVSYNIFVTHEA